MRRSLDRKTSMRQAPVKKAYSIVAILVILVMITSACGTPILPAKSSPTPAATTSTVEAEPKATEIPTEDLPPTILQATPYPSSEIGLDGAVTISFNQPMDKASVEAALQFQPGLGGSIAWADDSTFTFTPDQPLSPSTDVTVTVDTTARASNGLALQKPVEISYRSAGYLKLTEGLPQAGAVDIDPTSAIVAAFNQPVVALGSDGADLPAPLTITPAVEGTGKWINTSTYVFYPSPSLGGGKTFTVQVNPELKSAGGSPFDASDTNSTTSQTWTFTTALPVVSEVLPDANLPVAIDADFTLKFNQPMGMASVEQNYSISDLAGNAVPGSFAWNDEQTQLTFTPDRRLDRGTQYQLVLAGAAQAYGGTAINQDTRVIFMTYPELSVQSSDPIEGGTLTSYSSYASITLKLSAPVQADQLQDQVSISPSVSEMYTYLDIDQMTVYVSGYFDSDQSYTLTISPNLTDKWGRAMGTPYLLNFQSGPALPSLLVNANMYSAGPTYLTTSDAYLAGSATNISSINITRGSVTLPDFFSLVGAQGYSFLQTYQPRNASSWSQSVSTTPNQAEPIQIEISPDGSTLPAGIYYYSIQSPELMAQGQPASQPLYVIVSPVQMVLKTNTTGALVWATQVADNQPVADALITLYDAEGNVLGQGTTGADGLVEVTYATSPQPYTAVYAVLGEPGQSDFSLASSTWNAGVAGWDFGLPNDYSGPHQQIYVYTDRPIYKPGDTVYFKTVVRQDDYGNYTLSDAYHLQVEVYGVTNQNGESPLIGSFDLPLNAFGTGNGSFTIPEDSATGYYWIHPVSDYYSDLYFEVANYSKPDVEVNLSLTPDEVQAGQSVKATVQADYYFGAPAGNLSVQWTWYRKQSSFYLDQAVVGATSLAEMSSRNYASSQYGMMVSQGEGKTGQDGSLVLDLSTDGKEWADEGLPYTYTLEVTVTDTNNQWISSQATTTVHPASFYAGIQPDSWVTTAEQETGFTIYTVNWGDQAVAEDGLTVTFSRVEWKQTYLTGLSAGGYTLTPELTEVSSANFQTDSTGRARVMFTPPEPGTYVLDVSGNGAHSQGLIWVNGAGEAAWPNLPNQQLELTPNATNYRPGDTAQVFIPNPFGKTVQALVTVERGKILSKEIVSIDGNGMTFAVPLSSADAPNVYVSVTMLGRNANDDPDFRQGYVNLMVDPETQVLNVEVTQTSTMVDPGGDVTLGVRVTDQDGNPVRGEFSMAVVDEAALALAQSQAPGIVKEFYSTQPIGVQMGLSMAAYALRSTYFNAGGQGGGGSGQIFDIRQDFRDTAYWSAQLVTDANGEAQVSIKMPENLTAWQVDVRGITADSRVGEAVSEVITTKNLLVRPVTPDFFVAGDHVQLAATVHNNTQRTLDTQVALQATGFTLDDAATQTQPVSVSPGSQATVTWLGTVEAVAGVDLVFSAQSGDLSDASKPEIGTIPVYAYQATQTFSTSGELTDNGEALEVVSVPEPSTVLGGELNVEVSPSLAAAMIEGLKALDQSKATSTEAVLSRFLPNMETRRILTEFGIQAPDLLANLDTQITASVAKLAKAQNLDGGWGWSTNSKSNTLMTAYILMGLSRASKSGVEIDMDMIYRAQEYLRSNLYTPNDVTERWQLDRLAFLQYALQESAVGDLQAARALYAVRDQLNPWAQAMLAITIENLSPGDEQAKTLISDLEASAIRSATGAHWEESEAGRQNMSSPVTTTAVVVWAIAQRDPASEVLPEAVRYLLAQRQHDGAWASTYETAWAIMGLGEALKGTGESQASYAYSAIVNGAQILSGQANGLSSTPSEASLSLDNLHLDAPNALRILRQTGSGRLYYNAALVVNRKAEEAEPIQSGMTLDRLYSLLSVDCKIGECESISGVDLSASESQVRVQLVLTVPNTMYNVMIEDYVPAGADIVDTRLLTSQQGTDVGATASVYDPSDPFSSQWGAQYFSAADIYDNRIAWSAEELPAGTYVLSYTLTPQQVGEFQVLPAHAWETYFPDVQATTTGQVFTIGQ